MLRFLLAAFFILHGLVHLLWFVVHWRITTVEGLPYATTVLAGRIDLRETGIRIVGLLWLLAALGWIIAGIGVLILAPWWQGAAIAVALFAAVMCVFGLPDAKYGLLINLGVVAFVLLGDRLHWLP